MTAPTLAPLVLLLGCDSPAPERIGAPELRVAEKQPTVVLAAWAPPADDPDTLALAWSLDGEQWQQAPAEAGPRWQALAFGLRPSTEYRFRLEGSWGDEVLIGPEQRFTTGGLPTDAPALTVEEDEAVDGYLAVGINNATGGAAVVDGTGAVVWWWPVPHPDLLITRVMRSDDQRSVLVSSFVPISEYDDSTLALHRVAYDGTLLESIPTPGAHHDFTELPDGTLAWLGGEEREFGGPPIRGDLLIERSPDGEERVVWNCWDDFTYDPEDPRLDTRFLHANALRYDADTDRYWVGVRNLGALLVIDRQSGEIVERYFGQDSSFPLTAGTPVAYQHAFTLLDDGFLVMDDRKKEDEVSRAAEFAVDREAGTFAQTWQYESDRGFHIVGLGDALRLDDGDSLLIWSSAGQLQRVTADGRTRFRATTELGTILGYGQHSTDTTALPR